MLRDALVRILVGYEYSNFYGINFGLRLQLLDWKFPIAAGEGDLFEGLAWEIWCEIRCANGVPFLEWAEGVFGGEECD